MIELRPIAREDLRWLYHQCLVKDFPPEERKSFQSMERLVRLGEYDTWGLYDGEELLAYALLWVGEDREYVMLDYLAVKPRRRGEGLGTQVLGLLEERYRNYRGILVEAESPRSDAGEAVNAQRRRRLDFYRRAGYRDLDRVAFLFDVWYTLLISRRTPVGETAAILDMHEKLYKRGAALAGKRYTPILYEKS